MRVSRVAVILLLCLGVLAASALAETQPAARGHRVGVLLPAPATAVVPHVEALRGRLRELGYLDGQNFALEGKSVTSTEDELDRLAADLVRSKLDLLVAWTTPATLAANRATSTIPIVMVSVGDPVGSGLVGSLSRPGGNVTGVSNVSRDVSGKLLQLIRDIRPEAMRLAVVRNPANPGSDLMWREVQAGGGYVDRILKGARPADLPVEQPIHSELAVNLKVVRALGVTIPPSVLARVDHVIQ